MRLTEEQLNDVVVQVVRDLTHGRNIERRRIIDEAERRVRASGHWELDDDRESQSTSPKSIGRANIDWSITKCKRQGRLDNPAHNQWRVAAGELE